MKPCKSSLWQAIMELLEVCLRTTYFQVDDKFFQQLQNFLSHLNSFGPTIQFTKETESGSVIPFFNVLAIRTHVATCEKKFNSDSLQKSFHHL
jgi:hypothetical protein